MDDKMYLTATAQGEVKGTGGRAEEKLAHVCSGLEWSLDFSVFSAFFMV